MGKDPWAHGITQNSAALNKFLDFSYSQGLLSKNPGSRSYLLTWATDRSAYHSL